MQRQHLAMSKTFNQDRGQSVRKIGAFAFNKIAFGLATLVIILGFAVPAHANTADTTIGVPVVSPVQALPTDNVTITVVVTCDNPNGNHAHGGCTGADTPATAGSVEFFAYLPAGLASCDDDPGAPISLGAADNNGGDGWSVTFTPDGIGLVEGEVYFIRIEYTGAGANGEGTDDSDLNSGCAALATLEVEEEPNFSKELVSGPSDDVGVDVLGEATNLDPNGLGPDDGIIYIRLEVPQHFVYRILIDNDEGIPLIVSDVVGADFDLNGIDVEGGVEVTVGTCTFDTSQPHPGNDTPAKEPEFIDIQVPIDAECEVEVHVVTVENPGSNDFFEPTGTRMIGETDPGAVPIFDTYTLNEGIKVFDASDGADSGERIIGPVGSLQLTPIFPAP